jgi:acetyltransferase-like isoleucine patch superfamily enzyme
MDWSLPISVSYNNPPTALEALAAFLGHYDCRVYLEDEAYVDVGGGSLILIERVVDWSVGARGKLGEIGRFCQFDLGVSILAGGEHRNDLPVNITFNTLPLVGATFERQALSETRAFRIGNGVVISGGSRVRAGVEIGDGAVIGAQTFVNRDVEPYAIVGGVPAKVLKRRTPAQPWWNFDVAYLFNNLGDIQRLAAAPGPHRWRLDRPPFVIRRRGSNYEFQGFLDGDAIRPLTDAPRQVQAYIAQAFSGSTPRQWLADCWA